MASAIRNLAAIEEGRRHDVKGVSKDMMLQWLYEHGNHKVKYPTTHNWDYLANLVREKQPQYFPHPHSNLPASIPANQPIEEVERPRRRRSTAQPATSSSLAHTSIAPSPSGGPIHPSLSQTEVSSLTHENAGETKPLKKKRIASTSFEEKSKKRSATPKSTGDKRSFSSPPLMVKKKIRSQSSFKNESFLDASASTGIFPTVPISNKCNDAPAINQGLNSNTADQSVGGISQVPVREVEPLIKTSDVEVDSGKYEETVPSTLNLEKDDQQVSHVADLMCFQEIDIFGLENHITGADIPPITPIQLSSTTSSTRSNDYKSGVQVFQEVQSREKLREKQICDLEKRVEDLDKQVRRLLKRLKHTEEDLKHAIEAINGLLESNSEDSSSCPEVLSSASEEH
ncbi:hypothetical protein DFH28DRAFT_925783 [Melampsora americana]|nr:hypothetical protein DFH28DRAFT_933555 [Melampsora americana]KAH9818286.1 hypothetical protein DFH28DRAFT_925783 [Melampsora americana]